LQHREREPVLLAQVQERRVGQQRERLFPESVVCLVHGRASRSRAYLSADLLSTLPIRLWFAACKSSAARAASSRSVLPSSSTSSAQSRYGANASTSSVVSTGGRSKTTMREG